MTGYLSLLRDGAFGPLSNEQREIVGIISKNLWRINLLLDDHKDLKRIEEAPVTFEKCLTPVREILKSIILELRSIVKEKGIELKLVVEDDPMVFVEVQPIKRALLHIVQNSVNYTSYGPVLVRAHSEGSFTIIVVRDSGVGIDAEDRNRIFEKYYRSSNPFVRESPGAGLGLYIAEAYIRSHGGTIEFDSSTGDDTVFTVRLPAIPSPEDPPEES